MIDDGLRGLWNRIQGSNGHSSGSSEESDEDADKNAGRPTAETDGGSGLFECPECGTVYIGAEKSTCQSCRTEVTEVRSTLATEETRPVG